MMSDAVLLSILRIRSYQERYPEVYAPYAMEIALAVGAMETLLRKLDEPAIKAVEKDLWPRQEPEF